MYSSVDQRQWQTLPSWLDISINCNNATVCQKHHGLLCREDTLFFFQNRSRWGLWVWWGDIINIVWNKPNLHNINQSRLFWQWIVPWWLETWMLLWWIWRRLKQWQQCHFLARTCWNEVIMKMQMMMVSWVFRAASIAFLWNACLVQNQKMS